MKKRKKSKNGNNTHYFTEEHEKAIISFINSNSRASREKLYVETIQPVLSKLVDKIVDTYKFNNIPNIDELKEECKTWLVTNLHKYDESKKSKAFSYFSVMTKHWFVAAGKKSSKRCRVEYRYYDIPPELEKKYLSIDMEYDSKRSDDEFWGHFWDEYGEWSDDVSKENEMKVLHAIKEIFDKAETLEEENKPFHKKAVYFYLREITGLNTKQIVCVLDKYRPRYKEFRNKWDSGDF